jgi:hypothetical protein
MSAEGISAPAHLTAEHDVSAFDSGTPELDNWLKRRALALTRNKALVPRFSRTPCSAPSRPLKSPAFARCMLHAMSDDAKRFYVRAGFHECPVDPMMMITLAEVEKNLSPPSAR